MIKGVKVSGTISISHTLFVNDVIIFGCGIFAEWFSIKGLTNLFFGVSSMTFSIVKSCFRHSGVDDNTLHAIEHLFSVQSKHLQDGFSYLGFFHIPNSYGISDWDWLVRKVHFCMSCWSSKWISFVGCLTLVTFVFQSLHCIVLGYSMFLIASWTTIVVYSLDSCGQVHRILQNST